jgi:hypothetical protein
MVTSGGFLVNGLSGKMRIQNFPVFLVARAKTTRDASISRSLIQPLSSVLRPETSQTVQRYLEEISYER